MNWWEANFTNCQNFIAIKKQLFMHNEINDGFLINIDNLLDVQLAVEQSKLDKEKPSELPTASANSKNIRDITQEEKRNKLAKEKLLKLQRTQPCALAHSKKHCKNTN